MPLILITAEQKEKKEEEEESMSVDDLLLSRDKVKSITFPTYTAPEKKDDMVRPKKLIVCFSGTFFRK